MIVVAGKRMKNPVVILTVLGLGMPGLPALAEPPPPATVPLPFVRPDSPTAAAFPMPSTTGSIPRTGRLAATSPLAVGLDALSANDAARAIEARSRLPQGSLDRHILTWAIAISGLPGVPSREIAAARHELAGWPGLDGLRERSERALYRENPDRDAILTAFAKEPPQTPEGAILLARALGQSGRTDEAAKTIRHIWISEPLDKRLEDRILKEFSPLLTVQDHKRRMDYLLYRSRITQAKRFSDLGEAQSLFNAWRALIRNAGNTEALVKAVDPSWADDPAFLHIRIEVLRRKEKYEEAAALLDKAPGDAALLINTGEWWNERRIVARGLADQGDFKRAYALVSRHSATRPADIADAEFHAGWYALRKLGDLPAAEKHFRRIIETSSQPLSASRGWYWLGRTAEKTGSGKAEEFFRQAASHSGTFYGQLAAARLDTRTLDVTQPEPTPADRAAYAGREAVRAMARLEATGHGRRAETLARAFAKELQSPGELALLAGRAERSGDHNLALYIGKTAFARGADVAALAFPIGVIPAGADIAGSGKALAYSIARQESAFNPAAVSPADARGLLQLLPSTASGVAKRHGLSYAPAMLTRDPGYNATLGAHYLGEQIDSFGGSYVLTFIAYNAGPRRVREWIARYGDPRGKPVDEVIDWIERIPFPETRNYVQRIMENYQVYKTRLGQEADIVADLRFGRQPD